MDEDFYTVLGVLPDAEDIVIKAAYRALAQRYHPDKWSGDRAQAHRKMAQLNEAYRVLCDDSLRADHDRRRATSAKSSYADEGSVDHEEAFSSALDGLEERWRLACSIYPDLQAIRSRLSKFSTSMAFAYVVAILEQKAFTRRRDIAGHMEGEFVERYFGTNPEIVAFAKELVATGEKAAAKDLNTLVDVLGSRIDPGPVIKKVDETHGVRARWAMAQAAASDAAHTRQLRQDLADDTTFPVARRLAAHLGYRVSVVTSRLLWWRSVFRIETPDGEKIDFGGIEEMTYWIKWKLGSTPQGD